MVLALSLMCPAASAQTVVHSFDGDTGPGLAACQSGITHCDRPEMDAASNGSEVVQVTWQNVRVYDYNGHLIRSTPMAEFVRKAGLDPTPPKGKNPFEPHIVYDEFIGRWIISVTCLNDCILVSASSSPTGAWGGVYLTCLQGGPCLNYDPSIHIGYDKHGFYECAAHLGDDNPHTVPKVAADCFAVPESELGDIAHGKAPAHINRVHNMPLDLIPAIDHNRGKAARAPALFAAKTCDRTIPGACQYSTSFSFNWMVETFTWHGSKGTYNEGGAEQAVKTDVGSKENKWVYNTPCCGPLLSIAQAGNDTITIRAAESHRLMNLVQFGSHIEGVLGSGPCTSNCGSQGTDTTNVLFWVDLDCSKPAACVVSHTAKIAGPNFNPEFATLGVDAKGNVGIVAASSTASTDLSVLLWTHRKEDPDDKFTGPTTVAAGTQPYTCLNARNLVPLANAVGIFTALDPKDGAKLWATHQYSNSAEPCVWNTRIVEYQIEP